MFVFSEWTHQHGGPDVEFLLELCDEDVCGDEVRSVCLLHLADDIGHPFKLALCASHPQEVHLEIERIYTVRTLNWMAAILEKTFWNAFSRNLEWCLEIMNDHLVAKTERGGPLERNAFERLPLCVGIQRPMLDSPHKKPM